MQPDYSTVITRIYTLSDPDTQQIRYVGKTRQVSTNRFLKHIKDAKAGKHFRVSRWILSLLRKGVTPAFTVVEIVVGDAWKEAERRWIAHYRSQYGEQLTNLTDGGDGMSGWVMPEVTRQRLAKAGREISDATRAKRALALKGRKILPASREKMRASHIGKVHGPCSEATKAKIGAANKGNKGPRGLKRPAATRAKMSAAQLTANLAQSRTMMADAQVADARQRYCNTDITMRELSAEFGVGIAFIRHIVRGRTRLEAGGPISAGRQNKQIKCRQKVTQQPLLATAKMSSAGNS